MSIANTGETPLLRGGGITLESVIRKTDVSTRRTKIICTMGPASWSEEGLATLLDAGMNVARFNFSHGDHAGHGAVLERLRTVAKAKSRNIAVLLDTKGPEIRTGFFANNESKITLVKGDTIILTADYSFKGDSTKIACSYPQLANSVVPGQEILVADGSLVLTVLTTDPSRQEVSCRIENNATIGERKNMNLPGVVVDLPTFTEQDVCDIVDFGIKNKVDFIAASFVRKASDVANLRRLLAENGGQSIKIICKIENQEGLQNYDEILQATDSIMVARGDLGMEIPASKVFLAQKMMIRKANIAGKPVITATQMLESMINSPRPTRAECSDVANAVLDGTDAVMLSGETANGPYFEAAVKIMAHTCCEAESCRNYNLLYISVRNSILRTYKQLSVGESIASSAVKTSIDVEAKAIVVMSETGKMANYVAKFRPGMPILCVTPNSAAARQMSGLLLGVHTVVVDSVANFDELVEEVSHEMTSSGSFHIGDKIIFIAGRRSGNQMEQLQVVDLTSGKSHGHITTTGGVFYFNRELLVKFGEIFQQQKANADPGARSRVPQGNPSISTLGGVFFILVILICAIVARVYCEARPQRTTTTQEPGSSPSKHDGPSREEREKEIRNVLNENVFSSSQQPSTVQDQQKIVTTDSTAANIERDQCVICLQSFDSGEVVLEPVRQDCHHVFHKICIITWLIRHDECPYCRRDLFHFDDSCQV